MQRLTPIVKKLLWANVILFLAQNFLGFDLIDSFGLRSVLADNFKPYQFITHLFIHAGGMHLFSNMLSLIIFGPVLENTLGTKRFIIFYIITGLGAAVLYSLVHYVEIAKLQTLYHTYLAHPNPENFYTYLQHFSDKTYQTFYKFLHTFFEYPHNTTYIAQSKAIVKELYQLKAAAPIVGASGAIFGMLMAFAMLFPNVELFLFFIPIPIKAKYFVALYGIYELYAGIQENPSDNVGHFAHLGGILFAYLLIKWWNIKHNL